MPIKISIIIPIEEIGSVDSLEPLISDIGDDIVKHGYGNKITEENSNSISVDSLNSYIFISEDITELSENLESTLFIIPVEE